MEYHYKKNYLEKMPFDYYDFFNKNYVDGMTRIEKSKECIEAGFIDAGIVLHLLAQENLFHMKVIANIDKPKRKKKK